MKILNAREIEDLVKFPDLIHVIQQAYETFEAGNFVMPDRAHVAWKDNTLLLMPCFTDAAFSTKLVSVFPGNAGRNIPTIQGVVILNDSTTGEPVALLSGVKLTALRTAAVGGLAAQFLSPAETDTLGLVGAGMQGFYQVLAACSQRPIKTVTVLEHRGRDLGPFLADLGEKLPGVEFKTSKTVEKLLEESRLVITATTSSEPVLPEDPDRLRGRCVIGIGSFRPGMREFPEALFQCVDQCFVDTPFACKETGDLAVPLDKGWILPEAVIPFGRLVTGNVSLSDSATTLFKSVGMALFDLFTAVHVVEKAAGTDTGITVDL